MRHRTAVAIVRLVASTPVVAQVPATFTNLQAATPKVTCFTCHRGAVKPLAAPAGRGGAQAAWR